MKRQLDCKMYGVKGRYDTREYKRFQRLIYEL